MIGHARKKMLIVALVATLALTIWTRGRDTSVAEPAEASHAPAPAAEAAADKPAMNDGRIALERLGRRQLAKSDADPFVARTWYVPPPAPKPEPPPKPTAPPLPFQYVGRFADANDQGKSVVYLAKGNDAYSVKPGDTLDGQYRFEGIERGVLVFTYLPLSARQTLPLQ